MDDSQYSGALVGVLQMSDYVEDWKGKNGIHFTEKVIKFYREANKYVYKAEFGKGIAKDLEVNDLTGRSEHVSIHMKRESCVNITLKTVAPLKRR